MKKKTKKNNIQDNNKPSKTYTINELLILGEKENRIELAKPLFPKQKSDNE